MILERTRRDLLQDVARCLDALLARAHEAGVPHDDQPFVRSIIALDNALGRLAEVDAEHPEERLLALREQAQAVQARVDELQAAASALGRVLETGRDA